MAQFHVYANTNPVTRSIYPYLLDIQSNLLRDLRTTIVIPLSPAGIAGKAAIGTLCPEVEVNGQPYIVMTQQLAGVDRKILADEVGDLSAWRPAIIAALDFVISGF